MKIFVTRKIPQVGLDLLKQAGHEVAVSEFDRPLTREELMRVLQVCAEIREEVKLADWSSTRRRELNHVKRVVPAA